MFDPSSRRNAAECACVYCGEPLPFNTKGIRAWRVGDKFVCNEFCADGISSGHKSSRASSENKADLLDWIYPTD